MTELNTETPGTPETTFGTPAGGNDPARDAALAAEGEVVTEPATEDAVPGAETAPETTPAPETENVPAAPETPATGETVAPEATPATEPTEPAATPEQTPAPEQGGEVG